MNQTTFDYNEDGILMTDASDKIPQLCTAPFDGYLILACDNGQLSVDVNGKKAQLGAYETLILPPDTCLGHFTASADIHCHFLVITSEKAKELLQHHLDEWDRCLRHCQANPVIFPEESRDQFVYSLKILSAKMAQQKRPFNREVIQAIVRSICFDCLDLMMAAVPE